MPFAIVWRRIALMMAPMCLVACAQLTGASTPLVDYQPEAFDSTAHVRHFAASPTLTCEAARRALLSQGYVVTLAEPQQITGRKYFQPVSEHHVQLEFRVVCASESERTGATVAFVSGLKEQYVLRKVKESASVGVGGLGSLSLPIEGSMDSMVKVASQTVTDASLYERFFDLLSVYLDKAVDPKPRKAEDGTDVS